MLQQFVCCLPMKVKKEVTELFLHTLLEKFFLRLEWSGLTGKQLMAKVLDNAKPNELWTALKAALAHEKSRAISIVIAGLDEVSDNSDLFLQGIHGFISLLQKEGLGVKALLTIQPIHTLTEILTKVPKIEFDRERQGCEPSDMNLCLANTYKNVFPLFASTIHATAGSQKSMKALLNGYGNILSIWNGRHRQTLVFDI
jgi:hypothetical protein